MQACVAFDVLMNMEYQVISVRPTVLRKNGVRLPTLSARTPNGTEQISDGRSINVIVHASSSANSAETVSRSAASDWHPSLLDGNNLRQRWSLTRPFKGTTKMEVPIR